MRQDLSSFENPSLSIALQSYIQKTYAWMVGGLLVSGFTAYFISETLIYFFLLNPLLLLFLFLGQIGLVLFLSARVMRLRVGTAGFLFIFYSFLTGLTLSTIFLIYTSVIIQNVFFTTAALFAAMSFYGYTTKRDLTKLGSFLIMGLFGVIIAIIINIFLSSSALNFAISIIGALIFVGLTAYDTQKIKNMFYELSGDNEALGRYSILAALMLYLDFINLFLFLLRLFGRRE
ncbi:MAG: Bax inhibitor-1/YccA family protein [Ignavibacteria bacterium]|nr:Bax inhibitor-1/YccA family protein [Ignavibacteria bacterium]